MDNFVESLKTLIRRKFVMLDYGQFSGMSDPSLNDLLELRCVLNMAIQEKSMERMKEKNL